MMMVIRVLVTVQTDKVAAFVAHMQQECVEVKEMFAGCERFDLFADPANGERFLIYEEWETAEHFDAYRNSGYFQENGQVLFPMLAGAPDSAYFEAKRVF